MRQKSRTLWQIFFSFFKIGLVTFGGGLAMLPVFERLAVEDKKWISQKELGDIAIVAQSTPGAIAVNCAVFIGYRVAGVLGAVAAMLGAVLPSFFIICGVSLILPQVKDNVYFAGAIRGIGTCVTVLIFNAIFKLAKPMEKILYCFAIVAVTFLINLFLQVDIVFLILGGAVLGVFYQVAASRRNLKKCTDADNLNAKTADEKNEEKESKANKRGDGK